MPETCPECKQRPMKAKGLCGPCYKRLIWRPNGGAEKERARSRAYKEANRAATRTYYRRYEEEHKHPCSNGCGALITRSRVVCRACVRAAADARADRIVELYEAGVPVKKIAAAIGTTPEAISVDLITLRKDGRIGYRYKAYEHRSVGI